jgi:hypothetical protein
MYRTLFFLFSLSLFFLSLLSGCSTLSFYENEDKSWLNHLIVADFEGTSDKTSSPFSQKEHLENVIEAFKLHFKKDEYTPQKKLKIVLFIHGGLNGEKISLLRSREHTSLMRLEGIYPLFFNWNSEGLESYQDQITNIRQGRRISSANKLIYFSSLSLTPLYLISSLLEGFARTPISWANQGTELYKNALSHEGESYYNEKEDPLIQKRDQVFYQIVSPEEKNVLLTSLYGVVTSPLKALTVPFVDALGKEAWENMLRRTRLVLRLQEDFVSNENSSLLEEKANELQIQSIQNLFQKSKDPKKSLHPDKKALEWHGFGTFSQFLYLFQNALQQKVPQQEYLYQDCLEISIIAHSMGSIIANEIIRHFGDIPFHHIVYMAAACSIEHFYHTVVSSMEHQNKNVQFYNLMLHPWAEVSEISGLGILPTGSLLEWIDNFYEEANSDFGRTLGKWFNVRKVLHFFPQNLEKRLQFHIFGLNPQFPHSHGAFNDVFTQEGKVLENFFQNTQGELIDSQSKNKINLSSCPLSFKYWDKNTWSFDQKCLSE